MANKTTIPVQSMNEVCTTLNQLNRIDGLSFRLIALRPEYKGIPWGTLANVAAGREPKDAHTRMILGLPAMELAPVCLKCGQVHVTKRCMKKNGEPKPKPIPYEHYEQVAVMEICRMNEGNHPELRLLFAVPNGGLRNIRVAKDLKAEGVKAGVPDLFLLVPRGGFHGLVIEVKALNGNSTTEEQRAWIQAFLDQGYYARCCIGAEAVVNTIFAYLDLK
jgi:hypothetical protein